MRLRSILLPISTTGPRDFLERLAQLMLGLFLFGAGMALMVRAGIGVAPWDVLAVGLVQTTGLGFGLITSLVAGVVLLLWIPLRQRVGIGTVLNALLVGPSAEVTLAVVPAAPSAWVGVPLFLAGLVLLAFASGLYISAGFGPGPRDGLMTGLVARTGKPVWLVRTALEGGVLVSGFLLGGPVGLGTVVFAFGVGPLIGWFLGAFTRRRASRTPARMPVQ
ncbi:membrane protein YczE [Microbacterium alcoholitolerans]|uniref:membrane protein YczE n=1 Tax=unclassified Microbacterium TaxID=2609290 RepID=UPI003D179FC3